MPQSALRTRLRYNAMNLTRAILFDLDDTILVAFGPTRSQWQRAIAAFADQFGPIEARVIAAAMACSGLLGNPTRGTARRRRSARVHPASADRREQRWPSARARSHEG